MGKQPPFRLILASASPARRELLSRAGYTFSVKPANIDEASEMNLRDPRAMVQRIAWMKAAAVAPTLAEGLILSADTIGWLRGEAIGKPADEQDAWRILRLLSGQEHELWTGVCLWRRPDNIQTAWQEVSRVVLKPLTDSEIDTYLATRTWQGCSGAYAVEENNDPYVQVVAGSISNVIGLPMETLAGVLDGLSRLQDMRESEREGSVPHG